MNDIRNFRFSTATCILCGHNSVEKCSYLRFPVDSEQRKLWVQKCNLPEFADVSSARLCSNHFQLEDFSSTAVKRRRLKSNVFPSVFQFSINEIVNESEETNSSRNHISCLICGYNKNEKVSHYRFPKNAEDRELWIQRLKLDPSTNFNNARLCEKHFAADSMDQKNRIHRRSKIVPLKSESTSCRKLIKNSHKNVLCPKKRHCVICGPQEMSNVKFYRFPTDPVVRQNWVSSLNIDTSSVNLDRVFVCRFHFNNDDFSNDMQNATRLRLKKTALPSIIKSNESNVTSQNYFEGDSNSEKIVSLSENSITLNTLTSLNANNLETLAVQNSDKDTSGIFSTPDDETKPIISETILEDGSILFNCENEPTSTITPDLTVTTPTLLSTSTGITNPRRRYMIVPRYPGDIHASHISTPQNAQKCFEMTMNYIMQQKKQINLMQQKLRRANKRIESLENIISNLSDYNIINEDTI